MEQQPPSTKPSYGKSTEELIEKLRRSLQRDGDFPASARVVNELKSLTSQSKTTANQITEVILREPSLGTRVLHLVNSSFYRRAKPIMTVSQAVVQIGMRPLAELCAGLVLLQKFVPTARRGGPFATCLKQSIITALLTSQISAEVAAADGDAHTATKDEQGYLVGSFSEIGSLLLAYYFPKIYESAAKRSEAKNVPLDQSIKELTGLTPLQLSVEVLEALNMPAYYQAVLDHTDSFQTTGQMPAPTAAALSAGSVPVEKIARHVTAAQKISRVIVNSTNKAELDRALTELEGSVAINHTILAKTVGSLPTLFKDHCAAIDLNLPALPEFVSNYDPTEKSATSDSAKPSVEEQFGQFVEEIRQTVENREPTATVITSVMETFAWSLSFDRVILLLVDPTRKKLLGRMGLGNLGEIDPKTIERQLGSAAPRYAPDATAFSEARPIFNGDPILPDGWPLAVIPIGYGKRALGVIYADKINPENDELDPREQAAIGVLAELLDRSVGLNSEQ